MLPDIYNERKPQFATLIESRGNGPSFKKHNALGDAKGALVYHHWRADYFMTSEDRYTNGLYRLVDNEWILIFVATPHMSLEELKDLLRCIKG